MSSEENDEFYAKVTKIRNQLQRWARGSGVSEYGMVFLDFYNGKMKLEKFIAIHTKTDPNSLSGIELNAYRCVPSVYELLAGERK